jgi:hypothetical protein
MKPTPSDPMLDSAAAQSQGQQLIARKNSMLAPRERPGTPAMRRLVI